MEIFLSYAGENRDVADSIALGLREEGHNVFFDRDSLPVGSSYDDKIRNALNESDLLIFLISPDSVDAGSYTLTELKFARQRWKKVSGHVLPVMIETTPYSDIPAYLRSVTVLEPSGNAVAEVLARVDKFSVQNKRKYYWLFVLPIILLVIMATVYFLQPTEKWIIKGQVKDLTSNAPIPGVTVSIHEQGKLRSAESSSNKGEFTLAFTSSKLTTEPHSFKLKIVHEDFADFSQTINISENKLDKDYYLIKLFPKKLIQCQFGDEENKRPWVVIGYFSRKKNQVLADLSSRIASALTYDLKYNVLTLLQEIHVSNELLPYFGVCQQAQPRSLHSGGLLSKALGADAFISGDVSKDENGYTVRTYISDSFSLFDPPIRSENKGVNLDDPGAAHLALNTHANIMLAIASSYKNTQRYEDCIDVSVAAERLGGELTEQIKRIRQQCQKKIPHRGLLPEDSL